MILKLRPACGLTDDPRAFLEVVSDSFGQGVPHCCRVSEPIHPGGYRPSGALQLAQKKAPSIEPGVAFGRFHRTGGMFAGFLLARDTFAVFNYVLCGSGLSVGRMGRRWDVGSRAAL